MPKIYVVVNGFRVAQFENIKRLGLDEHVRRFVNNITADFIECSDNPFSVVVMRDADV